MLQLTKVYIHTHYLVRMRFYQILMQKIIRKKNQIHKLKINRQQCNFFFIFITLNIILIYDIYKYINAINAAINGINVNINGINV